MFVVCLDIHVFVIVCSCLVALFMFTDRFMQLQSNPKSHHIETEAALIAMETLWSHDSELLAHSSVFTVLGRVVGHTHLLFNVTTPTGHVISSTLAPVQVFDPLKLSPRHIVLLPTATFQVGGEGWGEGCTYTCVALPCCLFDLACFFLPSFSSLIKTCTCM